MLGVCNSRFTCIEVGSRERKDSPGAKLRSFLIMERRGAASKNHIEVGRSSTQSSGGSPKFPAVLSGGREHFDTMSVGAGAQRRGEGDREPYAQGRTECVQVERW
jgi:hypothetical protein